MLIDFSELLQVMGGNKEPYYLTISWLAVHCWSTVLILLFFTTILL
jgi:hypothetical protein